MEKRNVIEVDGALKVKARKGSYLVVRATDCDVDMNLGRVVIYCNGLSITERGKKEEK